MARPSTSQRPAGARTSAFGLAPDRAASALVREPPATRVPWWVIGAVAASMAAGTYTGGWRIIRTLGRRIVHLDPPRGFAAESAAASVLYATAFIWQAPISTTHTITSVILGTGATRRLSAVRWAMARNIATAWMQTMTIASHWVGLTLPGMIEEPGSFAGRFSSARPQRGPEASRRMSSAIFISGTARARSPAEAPSTASRPPWAANLFCAVVNG
ncbi:inorganic phosphate transporter [Streptomyces sp. M2CJ-2]|nr:inorganic phosphate transporter [Streptomyces sp. M2CJ-2]